MSNKLLVLWAAILFFQNYSFTYTSRARNSGSLVRHFKAAIFSNGIWILSQILMLGPMFDYLTGRHGFVNQIIAGAVYTVATVAGSLVAHFVSKKTERGMNAVGASKHYVQITKSEWDAAKATLAACQNIPSAEEFGRVRGMAEQAFDVVVGMIPDGGIKAAKFGDQVITTGLPNS